MPPLRVAIAGLGSIGRALAKALHAGGNGGIPGLVLTCAAAGDASRAKAWLEQNGIACPLLPPGDFPEHADIAIECAPAAHLASICRPMLEAGKQVMVLSSGALLRHPELIELAGSKGGRIAVPTGALLGLDAVLAAAEGDIRSVRMITRKPPGGLQGAPWLDRNAISIDGLAAPKLVFSGSARDAAEGFPANVNVAAALSLAGIGPDRTRIEIWADPSATRNCHTIEVEADSARFSLSIENVPSENPKTGKIVALSVIAALRKLRTALSVGT